MRGFTELTERWLRDPADGRAALHEFYRRAGELVRGRSAGWADVVTEGPMACAGRLLARARAVQAGDLDHLWGAAVTPLPPPVPGGARDGMCGRVWPYKPYQNIEVNL